MGGETEPRTACEVVSQSAETTQIPRRAAPGEFPSCAFIERGLVFLPEHYVVCCKGGLAWQTIGRFDSQSELSLAALLKVRQRIRAINRAGGHPICRKCGYLITHRWPRNPKYLISLINFSHFYKCNLKCRYCYTQNSGVRLGKGGWNPSSPLQSISKLIYQNVISPDANILWGGGEPSILSDFGEIFSLLADHGCRHTLNSNCVKLSYCVLKALRESDKVKLICSVDSGTPETFKRVKGVDAFEKVTENISAYCKAAKNLDNIALKYIFLSDNLHHKDIRGFLDVVSKNKISRCACDVDSGCHADLSGDLVFAMAKMIHELLTSGVTVAVHGPGVMSHVDARLRERLKRILVQGFGTPAEILEKRLTDAVWPDSHQ